MNYDAAHSIFSKLNMIKNKVPERWLEGLTLIGASVAGLSNVIEPQSKITARVATGSGFPETWQ